MTSKIFTTTALVAALVATSVERAEAQRSLAAGVLGGIIGGAIIAGAAQSQQRTRVVRRTVVVDSAARQQAREIQTALNHFGWNVGVVDGSLGPNSRNGIRNYQTYLNFPVTGQLLEFERLVLVTAYQRAIAGGAEVSRISSRHRDGVRGLLETVRDEMRGGGSRSAGAYGLPPEVADAVDTIAESSDPSAEQLVTRSGFVQLSDLNGDGRTDYIIDTSVTGSAFWCNAQACTVQVFVSTPDGYARNDFQSNDATPAAFDCLQSACRLSEGATVAVSAPAMPQGTAPAGTLAAPVAAAQPMVPNPGASPAAGATAAATPTRPSFLGGGARAQSASLASHCNRVGLVTSANGGYSDLGNMTDPVFTLNEQFCVARGYAIADGEALMTQLGVTPASVTGDCETLGQELQPQVSALSLQARDVVLGATTQWMLGSGMSTTDLATYARICLSSGYSADNLDVAIASALVLSALGETAYGELPAHHLMQGIGAVQRRDLASEWFNASVPVSLTTEVAFQPGPASRNQLVLQALAAASGETPAPMRAAVPLAPAVPAAPTAPAAPSGK
ncbi:peptidoglycan-binding protein [Rhodobacter sp. NTK016B]|uniref:peptidoglycan-binding domain-containing protein n=1 Tax=Rhodobacter sp. NTK016B TaxID=2759676 RepID=UPI001A8E9C24|nr:peptidoglycan-binding domain-containing protein [Rhodobacter sp. NTK016B]MBN8292897.1 peptidoglycan-binding protein [Rhodobacter sp. NTK016B]